MAYLDRTQLDQFEQILNEQLQKISHELQTLSAQIMGANESSDPLDRATSEEMRTLAIAQRERLLEQQRETLSAIRRIHDGEFGYCEETGDEIGIDRLMARPTSRFTMEVQSRHEIRSRQFSTR